jgi:hypothetical protein
MVAIVYRFTGFGVFAFLLGAFTFASSKSLVQLHGKFVRIFPWKVWRAAGSMIGVKSYQVSGIAIMLFGLLVTVASLFG